MKGMEGIIKFFEENQEKLVKKLKEVKVNQERTLIKLGSIDNEQLSLAFFIHGEPDPSIDNYRDKVKFLFNCEDEKLLENINKQIKQFKENTTFQISPYLKISKETEPTIHAFNLIIHYKNEKTEATSA